MARSKTEVEREACRLADGLIGGSVSLAEILAAVDARRCDRHPQDEEVSRWHRERTARAARAALEASEEYDDRDRAILGEIAGHNNMFAASQLATGTLAQHAAERRSAARHERNRLVRRIRLALTGGA